MAIKELQKLKNTATGLRQALEHGRDVCSTSSELTKHLYFADGKDDPRTSFTMEDFTIKLINSFRGNDLVDRTIVKEYFLKYLNANIYEIIRIISNRIENDIVSKKNKVIADLEKELNDLKDFK